MTLTPVPAITAEQENHRSEPLATAPGFNAVTSRRDPVEPIDKLGPPRNPSHGGKHP